MKALKAMAAAGAILAGCATAPARYDLTPIESNGQALSGLDANTILESRQPGGIVSLRAYEDFSDFGAGFVVGVRNMGQAVTSFGPADIKATSGGRALNVLAAEELEARVRAETTSFLRATDRRGDVDVDRATPEATREYRFNNFGGCPAGQSGCQIYSADNGSGYRQDRLNREADAQVVYEAALKLQRNQAVIAQKALRPAATAPGEMAGGVFVVEPPRGGGPILLTVTFGDKTHRFVFEAAPEGR